MLNTLLSVSDIAVVEMTEAFRQPSLFYHLGVRESFSMANNIILYCDSNSDSLQNLQVYESKFNIFYLKWHIYLSHDFLCDDLDDSEHYRDHVGTL